MNEQERVVIDISKDGFTDAVLTALERDTGAVPIVAEILRILKIKQRCEHQRMRRLENLARARAVKNQPKPVVIERKSWWQRIKLCVG